MPDPFAQAGYLPLPELSPYVRHDRFEQPKEVFKFIANTLARRTDSNHAYHMADIGCANGELLYYLRQRFAHWRFQGYDLTPEFIAAGRAYPPMAGIALEVGDLFALTGTFDIVSFINVMTVMDGAEEPLLKLLSLVNPGGLLLVDGIFNVDDIELRAVFMDNSRPESRGIWRREYSQFSRCSIAAILADRCRSFDFEEIPMNVDIPRRPEAPAINVWTFRDERGRRILTNGTHMMLEKTLLTVQV